jgi:hypothetical protein
MPIGGGHIHRRRTGQGCHVQVCDLAKNLISAGSSSQIDGSQRPDHEDDEFPAGSACGSRETLNKVSLSTGI